MREVKREAVEDNKWAHEHLLKLHEFFDGMTIDQIMNLLVHFTAMVCIDADVDPEDVYNGIKETIRANREH